MKVSGCANILILLASVGCQLFPTTEGSAVVVTNENWKTIINSNDLVLLNFYTDWCRFSQMLEPIFEEAAAKIREQFPEDGSVILGKVNCDTEAQLAQIFYISKYPTLKVARSGLIAYKEYRGQRSVNAFVQFVEEELSDPIKEIHNLTEWHNDEEGSGVVIGYFISRDHEEYFHYRKAARIWKTRCRFLVGFGEVSKDLHPPEKNTIVFRADSSTINHREYFSEYSGNMTSFEELISWMSKCQPLVWEITFDNAEELTEEGLPLVVIFYDKNDLGPVREFKTVVHTQLADEQRVMFLMADGALFVHPLRHMGKSQGDLPLIAIDSFKHMYAFPTFSDIHKPGALKKFIDDLHNGQLHWDYHMTSDYEDEANDTTAEAVIPPVVHESKFKELLPSKHRYTLINRTRDEL